ncbi:MAG: protein translocase subunit SecD, partial [bacterium]
SGTSTNKLIVELPGVTDIKEAENMINRTPKLEFKTVRPYGPEKEAIKVAIAEVERVVGTTSPAMISNFTSIPGVATDTLILAKQNPDFADSDVNGGLLKRAAVEFSQQAIDPTISIEFTSDGRDKFAKLTEANVGKPVAIFLDGEMISAPTVKEAIKDGKAVISGRFTVTEAKTLARDLNLGALPVPIVKESVQTIGATLGSEALDKGVRAGIIGFLVIALFMILWYRLPGVVAVFSLSIYVVIMLALFKLIPVTLTAAGIAGFILSIGIAVDANVLIFERMKEELKSGKKVQDAIEHGFSRAWTSIRDSNFSTVISSLILFWFGSSLIRGFGLNLALGVLVSMFTAITVTRSFLLALGLRGDNKLVRFLFSNGLTVVKKVENN